MFNLPFNVLLNNYAMNNFDTVSVYIDIYIYLAQPPEIGQGLGRFLSCGARKQVQT